MRPSKDQPKGHHLSISSNNSARSLSSFYTANKLEASTSYIERTARKLYPILTTLKKRMIPEKKVKDTVKEHREAMKKGLKEKGKVLMLEAEDEDSEDS